MTAVFMYGKRKVLKKKKPSNLTKKSTRPPLENEKRMRSREDLVSRRSTKNQRAAGEDKINF